MTVGSRAAAAVAGRPRLGAGRGGPTRSAPPESRQAIEPPPAPTVWMSSAGSESGRPAITRSAVSGTCAAAIRQTSQEVPPMSKQSDVALAGELGEQQRPADAAGGPGEHRERGVRPRARGVREAARGLHDLRLAQPAPGASPASRRR